MLILGIDPGFKTGAIAFFWENEAAPHVYDLPMSGGSLDPVLLANLLRPYNIEFAVVEEVGSMPKQGVSSTFKFGTGYGIILGVLAALEIPRAMVRPTEWKKHFRIAGKTKDPDAGRQKALQMWPSLANDLKRKMDGNRADAALLAYYGMQYL